MCDEDTISLNFDTIREEAHKLDIAAKDTAAVLEMARVQARGLDLGSGEAADMLVPMTSAWARNGVAGASASANHAKARRHIADVNCAILADSARRVNEAPG